MGELYFEIIKILEEEKSKYGDIAEQEFSKNGDTKYYEFMDGKYEAMETAINIINKMDK